MSDHSEKNAAFYDEYFDNSESFQSHYRDSVYFASWSYIVQIIRKIQNPKILEVGCGAGQLANYLYDEGYCKYHGFDFSQSAITLARKNVPSFSFELADAMDPSSYQFDYNLVITTEVLEHVQRDRFILEQLRPGSHIIFSVPSFDTVSHVRHFTSPWAVYGRYFPYIRDMRLTVIRRLFIGHGIIREEPASSLASLLRTNMDISPRTIPRIVWNLLKKRFTKYHLVWD